MTSAAVIPVRNRPSLIATAIASVQEQTLPLDEIIVVDDGSTDSTPEVVDQLSRSDRRIQLVRLPVSGGAAAARNIGIKTARSRWICFLDSDDIWMPEKHQRQSKKLSDFPDAIASFTGIRYRWPNGEEANILAPTNITLSRLRRVNYLSTTTTAMVRRDVLENVAGFDASLPSCQDWDLWIKLKKVGEFAIVREPLVIFNQTEPVRISVNKAKVLAGHCQVFERALEDIDDASERREIEAYHQFRLAEIYLHDLREPMAAFLLALKSMFGGPTIGALRLLLSATKAALIKRPSQPSGGPRL